MMTKPGNNQPRFIKQFVSSVIDFSSQYGSENPKSVSYSITNIVGEPRIFPLYGDYTQAAVFRTYGTWWDSVASSQPIKIRPSSKTFRGRDYVDLLFDEAVYPWSIGIYETYNPGAVVRILALSENLGEKGQPIPLPLKNDCLNWDILYPSGEDEGAELRKLVNVLILNKLRLNAKSVVLWECDALEDNLPNPCNESRMFAPVLSDSAHLTRIIRLEFCSTHLPYYTEIDAVELTGKLVHSLSSSVDLPMSFAAALQITDGEDDLGDDFINGYFDLIPRELIRYIFSFLPLPDLCRCALVCRLFQEQSYDPIQFTVIDLSSSWHIVNDDALSSIVAHCSSLSETMEDDSKPPKLPQVKAVNLSWCGGGGIVSQNCLVNFIERCGSNILTHLIISSSPAVSDDMLKGIVMHCPNLLHLDLQSCNSLTSEGLRRLHNLTNLIILNLYRTMVDDAGIICTIHSNPNLQHLNLGSCPKIADYDRVLQEISEHCVNVMSLDCWRAKSLSSSGLETLLSKCNQLQDLDFGWCGGLQSSSGCFKTLATQCPDLKQLYVTANRTISDVEIHTLADFCPNLQKLDILGTRLVSVSSIRRLLQSCKNLQFLDVSFCFEFTKQVVQSLETQFPHVAIKRSYQDEM